MKGELRLQSDHNVSPRFSLPMRKYSRRCDSLPEMTVPPANGRPSSVSISTLIMTPQCNDSHNYASQTTRLSSRAIFNSSWAYSPSSATTPLPLSTALRFYRLPPRSHSTRTSPLVSPSPILSKAYVSHSVHHRRLPDHSS